MSRSEASDNLSEGQTSPVPPPRDGLHFLTPPRSEGRRSFTSQRSQLSSEPFSPLRRPERFVGNFAANLGIPPFNPPTSGSPKYQRTSASMLDNQVYRRGTKKDNSAQCRAATTNWTSAIPKKATGGSTRPTTGPPNPGQKPKATSKPPGQSKDMECYKCMKKGHCSPDCRSKPFCNKCKAGHRSDGRGNCLYPPEDGHQKPSGGGGNQRNPPRNPKKPDRSAAIRVLAGLLQECGAKKSDLGF